jgi:adenosylhomocysteine nucleosidase
VHIVVQISARGEWRALLAYLPGLPPTTAVPVGEYTTYPLPAPHAHFEIVLLRGGVGKINAAASAQYALLTWRPPLYIVLGTAGAVDPRLAELDLILATRTIVHDLNPHLSPNDNTLIVDHTVDLPPLWDRCVFPFPIQRGVITTGDLDVTRENVERLRTLYNATIADWESGAVAKVCTMNQTACLILRGVTDTPTSAPTDQFQRYRQNTPEVMARLWQTMLVCVHHYLAGDA